MSDRHTRRSVTLDDYSERVIDQLVPRIYPSKSELIRDLLRKEAERRGIKV